MMENPGNRTTTLAQLPQWRRLEVLLAGAQDHVEEASTRMERGVELTGGYLPGSLMKELHGIAAVAAAQVRFACDPEKEKRRYKTSLELLEKIAIVTGVATAAVLKCGEELMLWWTELQTQINKSDAAVYVPLGLTAKTLQMQWSRRGEDFNLKLEAWQKDDGKHAKGPWTWLMLWQSMETMVALAAFQPDCY